MCCLLSKYNLNAEFNFDIHYSGWVSNARYQRLLLKRLSQIDLWWKQQKETHYTIYSYGTMPFKCKANAKPNAQQYALAVPCEPVHQFVVFSSDRTFSLRCRMKTWEHVKMCALCVCVVYVYICMLNTHFDFDSHSFVCWPSIVSTIEFWLSD